MRFKHELTIIIAALLAGCLQHQQLGTGTDAGPGDAGSGTGALSACPTGPLCWADPTPTGDEYRDVWASSDQDVWLVTQSGTIVHFDGTTLHAVYQAQVTVASALITGTGPSDVTVLLNSNLDAPAELHANGLQLHWDGQTWTSGTAGSEAMTTVSTVRGSNGQPVVAIGYANGSLPWFTAGPPTTSATPLLDAFISDADPSGAMTAFAMLEGAHVWMASSTDMLWHDIPPDPQDAHPVAVGVWGSSAQDVWAVYEADYVGPPPPTTEVTTVFRHFDGTTWTTVDRQSSPGSEVTVPFHDRHITGSAASNIWIAGRDAFVTWHWDGTSWSSAPAINGVSDGVLFATATSVWQAGTIGALHRWDGSQWRYVAGDTGNGPFIAALAVPEHDNVWALRASAADVPLTVQHFDGQTWSSLPSTADPPAYGQLAAAGPNDVWVCGRTSVDPTNGAYAQFVAHWDGAAWTESQGTTAFTPGSSAVGCTVWARSPTDAWASLDPNQVLHWDGATWTALALPVATAIVQISGTAADDVWLVGSSSSPEDPNALLHWDGTSFSNHWNDVAPFGMTRVFAVGDHDVWGLSPSAIDLPNHEAIYHYDGASWTPLAADAIDLWGSGPDDVWFASYSVFTAGASSNDFGARTTLLHWDGTQLASPLVPVAASESSPVLAGAGRGDLWLGASGLLRMSLDQPPAN